MRNNGKNRSEADSYSVSEAAAALGVSIPTLKRMVAEGHLEAYRTPGSHLRILPESVEAMREGRQRQPRPVRDASPVLQNRREHLEELTLETQEFRVKRELEKLRREQQEEADRLEAEAQAREEEAAQRQAELELERERLELEEVEEIGRQELERAKERHRLEAEQEMAAFRCRWQEKASESLSEYEYRWLSATQRKEVLEGLEAEIQKRDRLEEPRMVAILARTLEALVEPLKTERDAQERRERLIKWALWNLPYSATDQEKVRATAAVREALCRCDPHADENELRTASQAAIQPVRQGIEKRLLDARLLDWAEGQLPWTRTDRDQARVRRECAEILAELPVSFSETEAKEALEPTVMEARREIEQRQAEKDRLARKATLVQQGVAEVSTCLSDLEHKGEITTEEHRDNEFITDVREAVQRHLEANLCGDETAEDVRKLTHKIIDGELK